ncbi:MAG: hypothetical protein JSV32_04975 [Dehalococcoidia bacterium]|nr:MAG: hypothetical protein JSV32_04975 [Dehalococcoidia bacterium]
MSGLVIPEIDLIEASQDNLLYRGIGTADILSAIIDLAETYVEIDRYIADDGIEAAIGDLVDAWQDGYLQFVQTDTLMPVWYNDIVEMYELDPLLCGEKSAELFDLQSDTTYNKDNGYYFIGYNPN